MLLSALRSVSLFSINHVLAGRSPKGFDDVTLLLALGPLRFLLFMRGNGSTAFGNLAKRVACTMCVSVSFEL